MGARARAPVAPGPVLAPDQTIGRTLLGVAVVLALTQLLGPVLRRLGQSVVPAPVLGGILLAPALLGGLPGHPAAWLFGAVRRRGAPERLRTMASAPAQFSGRRALVTGASSGIGEAIARALAQAGATVALLARRRERIDALAAELGGVAVAADVADEAALRAAVDTAAERLGGLDAACAVAGVQLMAPFADGRVDEWRRLLDVNVLGLLLTAHAALGHLRAAGGGDLVLMGSVAGTRVTGSEGAVYTGTKFAVHAMAEALRRELREDGTRVLLVAPGWVATELGSDMQDDAVREQIRGRQAEIGLDPAVIGAEVAHALALPRPATLQQVTIQSLEEA